MIEVDKEDEIPLETLQKLFNGNSLCLFDKYPNRIGESAMRVFEDTLVKGTLNFLLSNGGSKKRPSLVRPGSHRLWDKYPDLHIRFSSSYSILQHLAKGERKVPPSSIGDELFLACAFTLHPRLKDSYRGSALLSLLFPLIETERKPGMNWQALVTQSPWAIEGLFDLLRDTWVNFEKLKANIATIDIGDVFGFCQIQSSILGAYMEAIEKAGRRDLASFLLEAARVLFEQGEDPFAWVHTGIQWGGRPLSQRQEIRTSIGALLKTVGVIEGWAKEASLTPSFEENYKEAQTLLSCWNTSIREGVFDKARASLKSLEEIL